MRSLARFNLATKIAIVGIALIVGIGVFSLTKRNITKAGLTVDSVETSQHEVVIPKLEIRSGYVGHFWLPPAQPSKMVSSESRLPLVIVDPVSSFSDRSRRPVGARPPALTDSTDVTRPFIRVGLFNSESVVKVKVDKRSQIILEDGTILRTVQQNRQIKLNYDRATGKYTVRRGGWRKRTTQPVRIVPLKANAISTITNYENRPDWDLTLNDNQFYGVIELHFAPTTNLIWVVNELGIENYVQGIGEAGNENDLAYLKALLTAARTYVYYHYRYPTKHADEPYLVDTSANDQIYIGYGFSKRAPNIVKAVKQTRGSIVHYDNEPVVTPYFSQTDGRTRAWSEVWSGEKPYLISVADPCCTGETLTGHGVGMSAKGARYFAEESDWGWKKILKYYYTDVTIKRLWK